MNSGPFLTLLVFLPLVGAVVVAALPRSQAMHARRIALVFATLSLAMVAWIAARFNLSEGGLQFVERAAWIPDLGVDYFLGIDGLGLLLMALSAFVVPMAILASGGPESRDKWYLANMLALQSGLFGTFTALNFFHWFIFWELGLVPAYFLIKLWGGPGRARAAAQFFLYTLAGSVGLLLAFLAIYAAAGTFDFIRLAELGSEGRLTSLIASRIYLPGLAGSTVAALLFWGVFLGFAVKVPVFPFHTWLPDAYAEAPTGVTMVLTGVMSKMGLYGFLRILAPLFPQQMQGAMTALLVLSIATILASAFAALHQKDLKRMLAYSSMNHLGYCVLTVVALMHDPEGGNRWRTDQLAAASGCLVQLFNHGITAAALFCLAGYMERRGGTRSLDAYGGLRHIAPVLCGLMGISVFASLGLPGLNGFVGEFLIFKGVFGLAPWTAAMAVMGLLITAVFLLTLMHRVFHGPLPPQWNGFTDLTWQERATVAPAVGLMFLLGIYPQCVLVWINPTVVKFVEGLGL